MVSLSPTSLLRNTASPEVNVRFGREHFPNPLIITPLGLPALEWFQCGLFIKHWFNMCCQGNIPYGAIP